MHPPNCTPYRLPLASPSDPVAPPIQRTAIRRDMPPSTGYQVQQPRHQTSVPPLASQGAALISENDPDLPKTTALGTLTLQRPLTRGHGTYLSHGFIRLDHRGTRQAPYYKHLASAPPISLYRESLDAAVAVLVSSRH